MKTDYRLFLLIVGFAVSACNTQPSTNGESAPLGEVSADGGQSTVDDYESQKNVVHIAE